MTFLLALFLKCANVFLNQKIKTMRKTLFVTNHVGVANAQNYLTSEHAGLAVDIFKLQEPGALIRKIADNPYELVIIDGALGILYTKELSKKVLEKCDRKSIDLCCANIDLKIDGMEFLGCKYADHIKGSGAFCRAVAA